MIKLLLALMVLGLARFPVELSSLQGEAPQEGVATMYARETSPPLYCDQFIGPDGSLTYGVATGPWVALDVGDYGDFADCGDWLLIVFDDGQVWPARALDAGWLDNEHVAGLPIVVDIPEVWRHDKKLSWPVAVYNISQWVRR